MIREGTPQDIPELARLRAVWAEGADGPVGTDFMGAFRGWLAANPRTFFVAEDPSGH